MLGSAFWVEHTYRISWNTLSNVGYVGSRCLSSKIESKSWRSGGGLSGEIGLKRSGLLRFRPRPSFETAVFAGSKSCPPRSSPATAEPARSLGNHLIRVETRKVATYAHLRSLGPTFPHDSSTETVATYPQPPNTSCLAVHGHRRPRSFRCRRNWKVR